MERIEPLPPHAGAGLLTAGADAASADLAVILLHGRGGSADDILRLSTVVDRPAIAWLAPQAADGSWYPASFLAPAEQNRVGLASAHSVIGSILAELASIGLEADRCAVVGFSQGACLAADHAYRFARRYALVASFTGGLIGPPGARFEPRGALRGTPVYLGASRPDPHVPWERVEQTAEALGAMGASVEAVAFDGAPHALLPEQIERLAALIDDAVGGAERR